MPPALLVGAPPLLQTVALVHEELPLFVELPLVLLDAGAVHSLLGRVPRLLEGLEVPFLLPLRRLLELQLRAALVRANPDVAVAPDEPPVHELRVAEFCGVGVRSRVPEPGDDVALGRQDGIALDHGQHGGVLLRLPDAVQVRTSLPVPAVLLPPEPRLLLARSGGAAGEVQVHFLLQRMKDQVRDVPVDRGVGHEWQQGGVVAELLHGALRRRQVPGAGHLRNRVLDVVDRDGLHHHDLRVLVLEHANGGLEVRVVHLGHLEKAVLVPQRHHDHHLERLANEASHLRLQLVLHLRRDGHRGELLTAPIVQLHAMVRQDALHELHVGVAGGAALAESDVVAQDNHDARGGHRDARPAGRTASHGQAMVERARAHRRCGESPSLP
mmetsp:Transcript_81997/g.230051  ORF Transcript_81997/g.230051 Transcript_81997/m.230051 type:complete len:384 (+) Transcript_81997:148-1299(+)